MKASNWTSDVLVDPLAMLEDLRVSVALMKLDLSKLMRGFQEAPSGPIPSEGKLLIPN
jgi:hypothetical protein